MFAVSLKLLVGDTDIHIVTQITILNKHHERFIVDLVVLRNFY